MSGTTVRWTDNHCHLDHEAQAGADAPPSVDDLVAEAAAAGVTRLIDIGTTIDDSGRAIGRAEQHDGVWATAGVHPHEAAAGVDGLADLLDSDHVVAVGECGLDFHYDHSPRPAQMQAFAEQVRLAHEHDLALVIHTREAWPETFAVLDAEGVPERTVLHCFTGGPAEAEAGLERGLYVSFSGIITFPGAGDVRAAAAVCPLDRIVIETDAPFLAPVPHRGRPNRPALVPVVGAAVAAEVGVGVDEVAAATWDNAARLYRLPPTG